MANSALSDASIRSFKPPEKGQLKYWDEKLPTFGVRISQGGSKTSILNYRNNYISIGRFPIISLSEARTQARRLLAEFTLGKGRPQAITYEQAVEAFLKDRAEKARARTVSAHPVPVRPPSFQR